MVDDPDEQGAGSVRIPYVPGLDGLRGAAVVAVLFFHGGYLQGGFLGVDLFFVLSGFLITSLLLAEGGSTGHIGLAHFWERRARRLLPALGVLLVGVAAYARFAADAEGLHQIRMDSLATMFYVANWRDVFSKTDYFALFTAPSPLEHTWSLAIEEQFYLVWPLVFAAMLALIRRRNPDAPRRTLASMTLGLTAVLAVLSELASLALAHLDGWNRAYYGTDTRAFAILVGAAVAALRVRNGPVPDGAPRRALEGIGLVGVFLLGATWVGLTFNSSVTHRGGLMVCSVAGAVVVAAVSHPTRGVVSRVASVAPLRWMGLISYGVYLYHWPIFVWLDTERVHQDGWSLFAIRCGVTIAAAVGSYFLIEQPIRHGSGWPKLANAAVPAAGFALVGVLVFASTATSKLDLQPANVSTAGAVSTAQQNKGPRIMVIGNSVAWFLVKDGFPHVTTNPKVTVLSKASPGCSYPGTDRFLLDDGSTTDQFTKTCDRGWRAAAAAFKPDYVLFLRNGLSADSKYHHDGSYLSTCSPAFHDWTVGLFTADAAAFAKTGATLVLVTSAPSLTHFGEEEVDRATYVKAVHCGNDVLREVAAAHPDTVKVIDLDAHLCKPDGTCRNTQDGITLRNDGTHFRDDGAPVITKWLLDQLGIPAQLD